MQHHLEEPS